MDPRTELRNFLSTRRARIPPQAAGLAVAGGHRRVPGLRREEVAMLAGVSVEYYTRLERGRASGVSDSVLDSIGSVLQLDDVEQSHLRRLIRGASAQTATPARPAPQELRPSLRYLLDAIEGAPAFIRDGRLNLRGANELGRRLYSPHYETHAEAAGPSERAEGGQTTHANIARFVFLDEGARTFYTDWEKVAGDIVATLHAEAGRVPDDDSLRELVAELGSGSGHFRRLWEAHDVMDQRAGILRLHHPVVGDVEVFMEATPLAADPGLTLVVLPVAPGSPSARALARLKDARRFRATADAGAG